MTQSKQVQAGVRSFPRQQDALEFFKALLNRYSPGDRVSSVDAIDLTALLALHRDSALKIGSGIDHFSVRTADYGTQCFEIVRTDASREDFTYIRCITQRW